MLKRYLHYMYMLAISLLLFNIAIWGYFFNAIHGSSVNKTTIQQTKEPTASPLPTEPPIPKTHELKGGTHSFQTFNNCGPASLSMALSHYDISISQQVLGDQLRPWQNAAGNNDDKSVTLAELAEKSEEFGFTPIHRPAGNIEIVKQFVANDMPVITRTILEKDSDIGHFRVILGYDDLKRRFLQDDSLQGNDLYYSYEDYLDLWKVYNYEFLVLVPEDKTALARQILGEFNNENYAWQQAVKTSQKELDVNPKDVFARFNLSVAYYHTAEYQKSIQEFEKVQDKLTFRTLWYQIEPILSYYEVANYDKVFQLTDDILNNHNRAFSELYALRGDIYEMQNNISAAVAEYENAVQYKQTEEDYKQKLTELRALL